MPIVYAAVAEDGSVVTEHQLAGNKTDFGKVVNVLLERMEHRNHKKSYSHEGYLLPLKYLPLPPSPAPSHGLSAK